MPNVTDMFELAYAEPFFNSVKSVFDIVSDGTTTVFSVMEVTVGPEELINIVNAPVPSDVWKLVHFG